MYTLAKLMGHEGIRVLQRYLKQTNLDTEEAHRRPAQWIIPNSYPYIKMGNIERLYETFVYTTVKDNQGSGLIHRFGWF